MVGKMQDSKKRTRLRVAMPPFPFKPMAQQMKMTIMVMKSQRTCLGLRNFIAPAAQNRPIAKRACAMASRFDPQACVVPGLTSCA